MVKTGLITRYGGGRNYWYALRDNESVPQSVPQDPRGNKPQEIVVMHIWRHRFYGFWSICTASVLQMHRKVSRMTRLRLE